MQTDELEEKLAHLIRANDELSDVVADQAARIARLEAQITLLLDRERGREAEATGGVFLGDERPPHW
ncbi:SlyX family protein [Palleronia caenipelagi]|uniref:SlyX family protein n=1 Tax=Palleronia caenipelagi TaxID=2489174 RepID=A0A547QB21_9RHOB|nr:SlyX family protein [Palleronia caenipelagi]TRD23591.1 SlyX family protein [Palleronia caenipelagi]